jgi:hypothetical protein
MKKALLTLAATIALATSAQATEQPKWFNTDWEKAQKQVELKRSSSWTEALSLMKTAPIYKQVVLENLSCYHLEKDNWREGEYVPNPVVNTFDGWFIDLTYQMAFGIDTRNEMMSQMPKVYKKGVRFDKFAVCEKQGYKDIKVTVYRGNELVEVLKHNHSIYIQFHTLSKHETQEKLSELN